MRFCGFELRNSGEVSSRLASEKAQLENRLRLAIYRRKVLRCLQSSHFSDELFSMRTNLDEFCHSRINSHSSRANVQARLAQPQVSVWQLQLIVCSNFRCVFIFYCAQFALSLLRVAGSLACDTQKSDLWLLKS